MGSWFREHSSLFWLGMVVGAAMGCSSRIQNQLATACQQPGRREDSAQNWDKRELISPTLTNLQFLPTYGSYQPTTPTNP